MTQLSSTIVPQERQPFTRIPMAAICSTCEQNTICSKCGNCHYCDDIDLPCAIVTISVPGGERDRRTTIPAYPEIQTKPHHNVTLVCYAILKEQRGSVVPALGDEGGSDTGWNIIHPSQDDNSGSPFASLFSSFPHKPTSGGAAVAQPQEKEAVLC